MSEYANNSAQPQGKLYCPNCGKAFGSGEMFCGECGTARPAGAGRCRNCGAEIKDGQDFCPNCGTKIEASNVPSINPAFNQLNGKPPKKKKKRIVLKIILIIILAIAVIIGGLYIYSVSTRVNLEKVYYDYCDPTWAVLVPPGVMLKVDTNPYDWDDDGLAYPEAYDALSRINEELGISSSLMDEFEETTAADGMRKRVFKHGFQELTVAWKYHPDKGLEVFYTTVEMKIE